MSDIFSIATSGLMAFQRALGTSGHNISNVDTPGYSRQRVLLGTRAPHHTGSGYFGTGVNITGVERIYDSYKVEQVRIHTSLNKEMNTYYDFASQVDNLVADPEAGLTPSLQTFFGSIQDVADNPSSSAARQVLISNGQSLVDRFHYLDQRLEDVTDGSNRQISYAVNEINSLAESIADINRMITTAGGRGEPNDLLDKRDYLVEQLAGYVSVDTVEQDNGAINVFIGKGQSLVLGNTFNSLAVVDNEFLPYQKEIVFEDGSGSSKVTKLISGGVLGGVLDFQAEVLEPTRAALGRVAAGLAEAINAQHHDGLDLNNNMGGDFFLAPSPSSFASPNNTILGSPALGYADVSQLTTDDYMLEYDGATWTLTNRRTNAVVPFSSGTGTNADPWIVDGMSISVEPITLPGTGQYLIRPAAHAAQDIEMAVSQPDRLAMAAALRVGEAIDINGAPLNSGTGTIANVSMDDTNVTAGNELPLGGDITLTYDDVAKEFTVAVPGARTLDAPAGGVIPYDPLVNDGQSQTITVDGIDITFRLGGAPVTGDQFIIADNFDAVSDNQNALALAGIEMAEILNGGTTTLQSGYAQMVGDVGAKTREIEINAMAEDRLLDQAIADRETVSGVNLDEEAANLIKFQQGYQATAQIIAAAQKMFDVLLASIGR